MLALRFAPILQVLVVVGWLAAAAPATAQQRVYKIGLTYPFPPWGVGPLEGVDFDLLEAICEANGPMQCQLEAMASEECVDTNRDGDMIIGSALASGAIDGCVAWYGTAERKRLGAEFTEGYSAGPQPQLIAADGDSRYDGLGSEGSLDGARVGFFAGFFSDDDCLAGHYGDFIPSFYSSEPAGRDQLVAALIGGEIDLAFWDSAATVPVGTHVVGEPALDCGPLLSMMVYPPSTGRPHQADALRRDFNCGLALIRQSGEMAEICAASQHPGGDPACVLEGPEPTVQCLNENTRGPQRRRRSR